MKKKILCYNFPKVFIFVCIFIFFQKKNITAQEISPDKYHQKKIGTHFLIDFPYSPFLTDDNPAHTTWLSITEDGNMRFSATHKKITKNDIPLSDFYHKEIRKSILPVGGMLYEQHYIEIAQYQGIKFRVKFRANSKKNTHKEQTYVIFLIHQDYYLFSYLYEGFERNPPREAEHHFFQSLHTK